MIAARNRRMAVTEFSSIESKPDAKLPSPREAMLKPAQIIIRRYFLAALAVGAVLSSARLSPAVGTSGLFVN